MLAEIVENVKTVIEKTGQINKRKTREIVTSVIDGRYSQWKKAPRLNHIPLAHSRAIVRRHRKHIASMQKKIFGKLPIDSELKRKLNSIAGYLFCKNIIDPAHSGIVIAGFGERETFPSVSAFLMEGIALGKLKYVQDQRKSGGIDFKTTSRIIPYAQDQMVYSFVFGIHPEYRDYLITYLSDLFGKLPENIVKAFGSSNKGESKKRLSDLKKITDDALETLAKGLRSYERNSQMRPITQAVAILPKGELAAMAESLVNLTVQKKKMSIESETVGGQIDVAVISKGDGFVWIKRKEYFNNELNPYFGQHVNT